MLLLSWNIQYGFGRDGRLDLSHLRSVLEQADIAALQEVDRHWSRSAMQDQPALIAAMLPDRFTAYAPGFDMDASVVEGGKVINRRRQFGPMILSRWPIAWARTHLLPLHAMEDPINTQTCALECCILAPSGPVRAWSVHLAHVGTAERLEQIALLHHLRRSFTTGPWSGTDDEPDRNWTESAAEPPLPRREVMMGDFNMEPGSAEYRALVGETPYHPGARYRGALVDAVAATGTRLHTHEKVIAGQMCLRQLDHAFVSADLATHCRAARSDIGEIASDHFPLWIEIDI